MNELPDLNHPITTHSESAVTKMTISNNGEWAGPERSSEERNDEDKTSRKSNQNYTTSISNLTADAQSSGEGDGLISLQKYQEEETPLTLDLMNLSHHSLDLGFGLFPGDDLLDGGLSVSSFCFHDSQENMEQNQGPDSHTNGNPANRYRDAPLSSADMQVPSDQAAERFVSDKDGTPPTINCIDVKEISDIITSGGIESSDPAKTGHLSEKEYDDPKATNSNLFSEICFPSSDLPTAAGIINNNPFHNETEDNFCPPSKGIGNTINHGGAALYTDPLTYRPNSNSALVSESGTSVTAASVRNDVGQVGQLQNKDSSVYFVPNTVQVNPGDNKERNGMSYDYAPAHGPGRTFMPDDTQNTSSVEEKIRQQHMQSYTKWQDENFPRPERISQRRVPVSMHKTVSEFPVPTSRARQGRRFSMPALSTSSNYNMMQERAQDTREGSRNPQQQTWQNELPQTLEGGHQMQEQVSSEYKYSMDNGESKLNGPPPTINRKRQDRRFSMPTTFSSSTNEHEQSDFSTPNMYGLNSTSGIPRRRQARRLSNESLSSSIHDHVAHAHSIDNLGQGNMQNALDPTGGSARRMSNPAGSARIMSRRFSNETVSSYHNDIAFAHSMQTQSFMNQQGGMQFFPNPTEAPIISDRRQGRRLSMPTFSSNLQDHANLMRFQTHPMPGSSSLLLPISAVTHQSSFLVTNPQISNCSAPGIDDRVEKSKSLSHISPYLDVQQDFGSNCVISAADRELATDFSFAVLTEVEACTFGKQDRTGKRRSLPLGFQGLACRHCRGLSKIGGRLFPSTIKTMSDTNKTLMALYNHLIKCPVCPNNKKRYLQYLKESHDDERKNKRYGSQKALFSKIWKGLHGKCPPV
jgi:hypothetical protein